MEHIVDGNALAKQWQLLNLDMQKKARLNAELFQETFAKTFDLLKGYALEAQVAKEHLPLIISAHAFSMAQRENGEAQCNAACVLTERMLHRCLLDREIAVVPEGAYVYLLEARKELYLDFNDVHVALETLTALMHDRELM